MSHPVPRLLHIFSHEGPHVEEVCSALSEIGVSADRAEDCYLGLARLVAQPPGTYAAVLVCLHGLSSHEGEFFQIVRRRYGMPVCVYGPDGHELNTAWAVRQGARGSITPGELLGLWERASSNGHHGPAGLEAAPVAADPPPPPATAAAEPAGKAGANSSKAAPAAPPADVEVPRPRPRLTDLLVDEMVRPRDTPVKPADLAGYSQSFTARRLPEASRQEAGDFWDLDTSAIEGIDNQEMTSLLSPEEWEMLLGDAPQPERDEDR